MKTQQTGFMANQSTELSSYFLENGLKILKALEIAYKHPENYPVLSSPLSLKQKLLIPEPLPEKGSKSSDIVDEVIKTIFSGYCNVSHPQYYGYISPKPLPISVLGDLLGEGLNQTPGAWRAGPAATVIETETLRWLSQFIGYEHHLGQVPNGIFTSGGSMANASALKLARDTILDRKVQDEGLVESPFRPTIYMSQEGHFSIWKALDFLGLGRNSLRSIEVTEDAKIDLNRLGEQIQKDLKNGYKPICVVGTAGTSATGAVDPLESLAKMAKDYDMWFHVDAAAGGVFANLPETRQHFQGLNLADSVTLDPCKWLFVPFGIGCLLTKNGSELLKSFQASSHYWEDLSEPDLFQMGLPGTRQWRSLGLWMAFKHLGYQGYHQLLSNTLSVANYLAETVKAHTDLELLQEPTLPVCCFRIANTTHSLSLNEVNHLVQELGVEKGHHYFTILDWRGTQFFRVSINNFETKTEHIDSLLETILHQVNFLKSNSLPHNSYDP
jgi:L-2,4-diaminobutyrate decarboxylase